MLRPNETCARRHTVVHPRWDLFAPLFLLAISCVVLVAITAQAASAAPGDPKQAPPKELWNAFPLNPKSQRLGSEASPKAPFTPPAKPPVAAEIPPEATGSNLPLLALAGGAGALIILMLLGFAVARRQLAGHRRRSAPLWQGTAGIEAGPVARLQHYADVDVAVTPPSTLVGGEVQRRSDTRLRRQSPSAHRDVRAIAQRMRRAIWNEDTAPFLVGSAIAIMAAFLIIYLVG